MDITNFYCQKIPIVIKQGEYGEELSFDCSGWIAEFGHGSVGWLIQRPYDSSAYPLPDVEDGNISTITLTETESEFVGKGLLEVFFVNDGQTDKRISQTFTFEVKPSLQNLGEVPEPWESYVDAVHADAVAAEESAQDSAQSAEDAREQAESILNLTATATVDNSVGIPSVSVDVTEDGTHKNMDFEFHNLKGETGDVNFCTFEIDEDGHLIASWTRDNTEIVFSLNNNGHLEVAIA